MLERARVKLDVDNKVIQAGKFNQKSTEHESRQILLEIISSTAGEEEEEEEAEEALPNEGVTGREELNRMLARSDEEYTEFMVSSSRVSTSFPPASANFSLILCHIEAKSFSSDCLDSVFLGSHLSRAHLPFTVFFYCVHLLCCPHGGGAENGRGRVWER